MRKPIALAAALVSIGALAAPVSAAPTSAVRLTSPSLLLDVQYREYEGRRYYPGRRYDAPPARWRRYHSRPYDWRRRGCIIVGPVWFCP